MEMVFLLWRCCLRWLTQPPWLPWCLVAAYGRGAATVVWGATFKNVPFQISLGTSPPPPPKKKQTKNKAKPTQKYLSRTSKVWFLQQKKTSWHEPVPSQTMPFLTQANGGHLAPQLTLQPSPLGGQGLFVEEGIESQTTILELPLEACLYLGANVLVYNSHCLFHPFSSPFPSFPIVVGKFISPQKKTTIETRNI